MLFFCVMCEQINATSVWTYAPSVYRILSHETREGQVEGGDGSDSEQVDTERSTYKIDGNTD